MFDRLRKRAEWQFFAVLPRADAGLAAAWWTILVFRGVLPAAFGVAMGVVVGAIQGGDPLAPSLAVLGAVFVVLQVLGPVHTALSANLGDRTADWLHARLTDACAASAWYPASRRPAAHRRPHRRARFRPRDHGAAAVHRD